LGQFHTELREGYEYLGQLPKDVPACGLVFSSEAVGRMHKLKQEEALSITYNYVIPCTEC